MKKKITTRLTAMLMAVLVVIGLLPVTALAAPTIDMGAKGTVTIFKQVPNKEGTGHVAFPDVTFTYSKIGVIEQIDLDTDNDGRADFTTIAYREVPAALLTSLGITTPDERVGGVNYYYAKTIQDKLTYANALKYLQTNGVTSKNMTKTDANGKTTVTNLEVGLYLFAETIYPANIKEPSDPFVISIPSNVTAEIGSGGKYENVHKDDTWLYDITAVPKNEIQEIEIEKDIVIDETQNTIAPEPEEGLSQGEDYQIGDTVKYQLRSDLPSTILSLKKYTIGDLLSEGLTFNRSSVQVWGVTSDDKFERLTLNTHYRVLNQTTTPKSTMKINNKDVTFEVDFFNSTLKGTNGNAYKQVIVEYNAVLNEKAAIYKDGNPNNVELEFSKTTDVNEGEVITVECEKDPTVYTYQIEVTKEGEASDNMQGVEFELRDATGKALRVKGQIGDYVISENGSGNTTLVVGSAGTIKIKGLDAGQYMLVETKTIKDYNLLKQPIIINIKAEMSGSQQYKKVSGYKEDTNGKPISGDYFMVTSSNLYAKVYDTTSNTVKSAQINTAGFTSGQYAKFAGEVYSDIACTIKVDRFDRVKSENKVAKVESNYKINGDGVIVFTVINKKGFELPITGGLGTYLFTIVGMLIVATAFVLLLNKRRKTRFEE